jgi:ubiquinone biosynthesis protein UbiJ
MSSFLLSPLNLFINQFINLDPDYNQLLTPLIGKTIRLEILQPKFTVFITFTGTALTLHSQLDAVADCTIRGSAFALLCLSRQSHKTAALAQGDVEILGDLNLAQHLNTLNTELNIDWEEQLSKFVGDFAAFKIGSALRKVWNWKQQCFDTLSQNLNEYLHEEACVLPPSMALNDFFDDIDTLKNDLERLSARFERLLGEDPAHV